ncbi:MAG: hypothetical protein JW867_02615 [Candidatus Omnitrophica bacterium]|nr:hypothetical protein [Candidatus Omnitrophota bacterium]
MSIMQGKIAPLSLSVKIITAMVMIVAAGFITATFYNKELLMPAGLLTLFILICYLIAPVRYEISNAKLIIYSRIRKKEFSGVKRISKLTSPISFGIRLWGNGGLFAATGIYWNKKYGRFRAYLTSTNQKDIVMVETSQTKIFISPDNPAKFIEFSK